MLKVSACPWLDLSGWPCTGLASVRGSKQLPDRAPFSCVRTKLTHRVPFRGLGD